MAAKRFPYVLLIYLYRSAEFRRL